MKTLRMVLLLFLIVLTTVNSQSKTSSLLDIRKLDESAFKFVETTNCGTVPYDFLYLGDDNFFISGYYAYANNVGPYYNNCVALANFKSGTLWKSDFLIADEFKSSNLSKTVVAGETLLTASTPNGLNYYSLAGEVKKTIPSLNGYKWFFPFYNHNLVVTMVNSVMYGHKINFETGQLLDSFYITSSVSWVDDVKEINGSIFLNIRKPDGGAAKSLIVKLNSDGIVWQTAINKIGQSYFAITPSIIYVAGDSVTMTGVTSKLIALDVSGNELWRRSFKYPSFGNMTLSRSIIINPYNNNCVIGGYVADPGGVAYFSSWNDIGELLWEALDTGVAFMRIFNIFWNEDNELLVCGDGSDENNSQAIIIKKYFIPGVTTDVADKTPSPTSFTLEQNYPNPFNPSTTITFTVPVETKVTLKVYDVLGKEVAELINGVHHPAGTYQVPFDGHKLPSGVYLYTLKTTDNYSMTKKMVLTK